MGCRQGQRQAVAVPPDQQRLIFAGFEVPPVTVCMRDARRNISSVGLHSQAGRLYTLSPGSVVYHACVVCFCCVCASRHRVDELSGEHGVIITPPPPSRRLRRRTRLRHGARRAVRAALAFSHHFGSAAQRARYVPTAAVNVSLM
jgi:hypothetical protein